MSVNSTRFPISVYDVAARNKWIATLLALPIFLIVCTTLVVIVNVADPVILATRLVPILIFTAVKIRTGWPGNNKMYGMNRARPASLRKHAYYLNCVESLAMGAGIPCPQALVLRDYQPYAFSYGNDPANSRICVTTALLDKMDRQQIEAVVAHEIAHIKNYDTLLTSILLSGVALIYSLTWVGYDASAPNLIANLRRPRFWILVVLSLGIIAAIGWTVDVHTAFVEVMIMVAGAFFIFLVLLFRAICLYILPDAVLREREFLADSEARLLVRSPEGLIGALSVMESCDSNVKIRNAFFVLLANASPELKGEEGICLLILKKLCPGVLRWLTPSYQERISRLKAMY